MSETEFINRIAALESRVEGLEALLRQSSGPKSGMLNIKEAAEYFNIGTKKMRRIAEDRLGDVAVYCGNRYLIVRPKFEEFICNSSEI